MINKLSLRQKFLIIGIVIYLCMFVLSYLSLSINHKSLKSLNSVVESFKKTHFVQYSFVEDLFFIREMSLSLVVSPNDDYKQEVDKKLLPLIEKLDKKFIKNPLFAQWFEYKKLLLKTREYALKGFDEGAFMNTSTAEREGFYHLIAQLKKMQEKEVNISEQKLISSKKTSLYNNYYIILTILFVALVMYSLDIFVIKKITNRILHVKQGLLNFFEYLSSPANYKKNLTINDTQGLDEINQIANAINEKVKYTKQIFDDNYKLIAQATKTMICIQNAQFGNRISIHTKSHELNNLKNVINEMLNSLEGKIQNEILQRTNQEKLLMQQSKLAAMGEMIGNIAHQWRQPISEINAILMELEAISKYGKLEKQTLYKSIKMTNKITNHMSSTISDFQNFFKPSKQKTKFSVLATCKKAVCIIEASLQNHSIALDFNTYEDKIINGYENEFSHAILNILSNAKDVLIQRNIKNPTISLSIKVGKIYTIIKILDNGGGIQVEDLNTIFEPYYTTKYAYQGTGIGLYMTKMIIQTSMHGFIDVKNTQNGALFTIKIA